MSEINDGGPAYPSGGIPGATDSRSVQRDGMSLRDYFAAHAIVGILSNHKLLELVDSANGNNPTRLAASIYAYGVSDAMLAARSKPKV